MPSKSDNQNLNQDFSSLIQGVFSTESHLQLQATTSFRKLLSNERNRPTQQVIEADVLPCFVKFLTRTDKPKLQFEAACALKYIASETSEEIVRLHAVPLFVQLVSSPDTDVREQAICALSNIAEGSSQYRDLVLACGALPSLLQQLLVPTNMSMLRHATRAMSNLCRGTPCPQFSTVRTAIPTLARLIHLSDEEVLSNACWALAYLTDGPDEKIQAVHEENVCTRLVQLLLHTSTSVQVPALRVVGNIVTGNNAHTQTIIDASALPCFLSLLSHPKRSIRKETCWAISNITAGSRDQIESVIQANMIPPLLNLLTYEEFEVKKDAAWAIGNAISTGTTKQIHFIVQQGCIRPLCDILREFDTRVVTVALEGLSNILQAGEEFRLEQGLDTNPYVEHIEAAGGLERIAALQNHGEGEVFERANHILQVYWVSSCEQI